jgi:hypothetical protein
MQSLINASGSHSNTKCLLRQDRRTSESQIQDQIKRLQDKMDLAQRSFAKMRLKFDASPRYSSEEHALKMSDAARAPSVNQKGRLKPICEPLRGASTTNLQVRDPSIPTGGLKSYGLFCRAKRRTEITEFVINLVRAFHGLSNFFAEQRAIAFT